MTEMPRDYPAMREKVYCFECGYRLRGMHVEDNCPDCGFPVKGSLGGRVLHCCRSSWLHGLKWSVRLAAANQIIVFGGFLAFNLSGDEMSVVFRFCYVLAFFGFTVVSAWLLTEPEQGGGTTVPIRSLQGFVRYGTLLGSLVFALSVLSHLWNPEPGVERLIIWLQVCAVVLLLLVNACWCISLSNLEERMSKSKLQPWIFLVLALQFAIGLFDGLSYFAAALWAEGTLRTPTPAWESLARQFSERGTVPVAVLSFGVYWYFHKQLQSEIGMAKDHYGV